MIFSARLFSSVIASSAFCRSSARADIAALTPISLSLFLRREPAAPAPPVFGRFLFQIPAVFLLLPSVLFPPRRLPLLFLRWLVQHWSFSTSAKITRSFSRSPARAASVRFFSAKIAPVFSALRQAVALPFFFSSASASSACRFPASKIFPLASADFFPASAASALFPRQPAPLRRRLVQLRSFGAHPKAASSFLRSSASALSRRSLSARSVSAFPRSSAISQSARFLSSETIAPAFLFFFLKRFLQNQLFKLGGFFPLLFKLQIFPGLFDFSAFFGQRLFRPFSFFGDDFFRAAFFQRYRFFGFLPLLGKSRRRPLFFGRRGFGFRFRGIDYFLPFAFSL